MSMTVREEQAADAGYFDGLNGREKFSSFKAFTDKETTEYKDQYETGLKVRKKEKMLASKN